MWTHYILNNANWLKYNNNVVSSNGTFMTPNVMALLKACWYLLA